MQQTITPIDNTIYIEREYNSDKIETTINNSTKAQISWYNLSIKERVVLLKKFVEDFLSRENIISEELSKQIGRPISQAASELKRFKERADYMLSIAEEKLSDIDVTKDNNFGGLINKFTVCEQILYELGDPENYISPDVVVDFTTISVKDLGDNKVLVEGIKGKKPTDTFKVSINYHKGYKAVGQLTISGPDAMQKANLIVNIIWDRLSRKGFEYDKKKSEFIGHDSCHRGIGKYPDNPSEIVLRIGVMDKDRNKVNEFGKEIAPLITNGPPGVTGFSGGRPKAQEVIAYWPTLIDKKIIKTEVICFE